MGKKIDERVLVVFSGGQDSTTCLMDAIDKYQEVETITFDYGQKHRIELECAHNICSKFGVSFNLVKTDIIEQIGDSALLASSEQSVSAQHTHNSGLPASFVPGRNLFFLTVAAMYAYKLGIKKVITGVSEEDYSGYPDCRYLTMIALQEALRAGMEYGVEIVTPFIHKTKTEEVELAKRIPNCMQALSMSHTCYNGEHPPCGICPSCKLRAAAFEAAHVPDPLIEACYEEKWNKEG